jgi:hypothetical protein
MATQVQNRRGTTAEHNTFTGAVGELTVDTTKDVVVVHDGSTAGGFPTLRQDQANLPTSAPSNGVYIPSSNNVAISTNGTGRLFVDASGNVGAGTSSPTLNTTGTCIHVSNASAGNAALTRYTTGDTGTAATDGLDVGMWSDGDAFFWLRESSNIRFATGSTERMRLDSSGRLGLGTSSAQALLDLTTGNDQDHLAIRNWPMLKPVGTGIRYGGYNSSQWTELSFWTSGLRAVTVDNLQRVGIGTTGPSAATHVVQPSSGSDTFRAENSASNNVIRLQAATSTDNYIDFYAGASSGSLILRGAGTERARIDSSGRLLVGTSTALSDASSVSRSLQVLGTSAATAGQFIARFDNSVNAPSLVLGKSKGATVGTYTVVNSGDQIGRLAFDATDGTKFVNAALIAAEVDGTPGANDMPGRLVFSTCPDGSASPTERMRITNGGNVLIGCQSLPSATVEGFVATGTSSGNRTSSGSSTSAYNHWVFYNGNGIVGSISTSASATTYATSSDYRLKENVVPLTGAADRVKQLQVHRFNFIADPDTTVDGFLAHEAQAVVPECVTGTKDAVDADGNPVYQGIDQSKLVPLLTAALQEALAEIESLRARLDAAGI